jgi:hypothetical protein
VSIATGTSGSPPSGYGFLGQQVNVTAPDASAANPLVLVFLIDGAALVQAGVDYTTVEIFRNGVAIAGCADPAAASPDPCVAARDPLAGGGARIAVRSSHASAWNFGASRALCSTTKVTVANAPFNKNAIGAGRFIWFSGVVKANGLGTGTATLKFSRQTVTFTAGGTTYTLVVPDGLVTFSSTATSATTSFAGNAWTTTVPLKLAGNIFVSGLAFKVPVSLPGNISPVTWQGIFSTDKPGFSISWKWAAAVYTQFSALNTLLGVKPVDDAKASAYRNGDAAGTPESFKQYLTAGARGTGGSNFTGDYTSAASVMPCK